MSNKETLEKFIKKYQKNKTYWSLNEKFDEARNIRVGAKWQQEQNKKFYTEEEVYSIIRMTLGMKESGKTDIEIIEQFEQFKKK
jgi:hypothetical protein